MKLLGRRWVGWFLLLWGVVALALLVSLWFLPFRWWSIAAAVGFGTMEAVGLKAEDAYPPLTQVIHEYLPQWAAFGLIYALVGGAGAFWFHVSKPWRMAALLGLLGWLTAHFDSTYDPKEAR